MAACCNHALWIETLKRQDRINRMHPSAMMLAPAALAPPIRTAVPRTVMPMTMQEGIGGYLPQTVAIAAPIPSPMPALPPVPTPPPMTTMPSGGQVCDKCKGKLSLVCYFCCQCGCRPATIGNTQQAPSPMRLGPSGDQMPRKCPCLNCPTKRKCGCTKSVSLDPRPIVIPILSCVICFPVLAFALICALRYRAQRLRRKEHLKRVQSGCRSVTLEIPAREKSSFYSKDSSSDPSLKGLGEVSQAMPESPPPPLLGPVPHPSTGRRRSSSQHVKFVTTTAVLHHGRAVTGLSHGRFKRAKGARKIFWDEHSSHAGAECAQELERELSLTLDNS